MDVKITFLNGDLDEEVYIKQLEVSTPMDPVEKLRPNTVGRLSRFTSNPSRQHWQAIIRVFKYLKGTMNYGLSYVGYPSVLEGYSDASWINHIKDSPSTSGWVFLLGGGSVSWASKKQTCIIGSTMEYEFVALAAAESSPKSTTGTPSSVVPIRIDLDSLPWGPVDRPRNFNYDPNQREEIRRLYYDRGPCRPRGHVFPSRSIGGKMVDMAESHSKIRRNKITNQHHFEVDIFNTVLDMQIQEFGDRFSESSTELLENMAALSPHNSFTDFNVSKLVKLSEMYPYDFTYMERLRLPTDLAVYYLIMSNDKDFSELTSISKLASLMLKLERCFSKMKLVKTDLRNRMGKEYFDGALICAIEKEELMNVTNEVVRKQFFGMKDRKGSK
ncbi:hypothetical protein Tco_1568211 [Tanacetum coccineum]